MRHPAIIKHIGRFVLRVRYLRHNVHISSNALFNLKTVFEDNIKVGNRTRIQDTNIGRNTYIGSYCVLQNCMIGRFCSIASGVKVIVNTHPSRTFVSTSPVFYSTIKQCGYTYVSHNKFEEHLTIGGKSIIIGNDVWIGADVTLIGGIKIGNGAIIALGAVVTKDVPPYAIVGGVPAKIIRYRFPENYIERLQNLQWWNLPDEIIQTHLEDFTDIEKFMQNNI